MANCKAIYMRGYRALAGYAEQAREYRRRYAQRNKHRFRRERKARQRLNDAIRRGDVIRKPCEVCGCPRVEAHHPDYLKPLEVRWLCKRHHTDLHTGEL